MIEIANNHSSLNNRIDNEIFVVRTLFVRSMDQIISSETHTYRRNRRAYGKRRKEREE